MYVRLLMNQQVSQDGITVTRYPGDWVDVGRQTALEWVSQGRAEIPAIAPDQLIPPGSGIAVVGTSPAWGGVFLKEIEHQVVPTYRVPYSNTLIWTPKLADVRQELLAVGFGLLETWDIAVPLFSYTHLAKDFKVKERELKMTEAAILDLRVPVYQPGLMFVRKGGPGEQVIETFAADIKSMPDGNIYLAFMRSLWAHKPRINALPTVWSSKLMKERGRR